MLRRTLLAAGLMAPFTAHARESGTVVTTTGERINDHGFRPAAAPRGATGWDVLGATRGVERNVGGFTMLAPVFPASVRDLDGRTVRVPGYMYAMSTAPRQTRYLLMAFPPSCPFCLDIGPAYFIDVLSRAGEPVSQDLMIVEGRLSLLDSDPDNFFYRLTDARRVRA